jgi:hypothetical protein
MLLTSRRARRYAGAVDAPEPEPAVPREELEVAVRARQELTAEHEPELVDAFLERVGKAIDVRVSGAIGVAIGSIALGIPVTAVAGNAAGLAA